LGKWNTKPVHVKLKADAEAVNSRYYYPVLHDIKERKKVQEELKTRLVEIKVLEPVSESQWGSLMLFIIPKKEGTGTVRFIIDYRKMNQSGDSKKPYPLPRIGETMQQLEGFQFATAIDLNMSNYTIEL